MTGSCPIRPLEADDTLEMARAPVPTDPWPDALINVGEAGPPASGFDVDLVALEDE